VVVDPLSLRPPCPSRFDPPCPLPSLCDASCLAGSLISHLLWTADACLLMSILGWVTAAAVGAASAYLWYMCICFWRVLRAAQEESRRVRRAIASLPSRKYKRVRRAGAASAQPAPPNGASDAASASSDPNGGTAPPLAAGSGAGEGVVAAADDDDEEEDGTCAICLCEFEEGEEVRLLPCYHEFCKECIDVWIERQGLSATCPLCKRRLVPARPNDPNGQGPSTPEGGAQEGAAAGGRAGQASSGDSRGAGSSSGVGSGGSDGAARGSGPGAGASQAAASPAPSSAQQDEALAIAAEVLARRRGGGACASAAARATEVRCSGSNAPTLEPLMAVDDGDAASLSAAEEGRASDTDSPRAAMLVSPRSWRGEEPELVQAPRQQEAEPSSVEASSVEVSSVEAAAPAAAEPDAAAAAVLSSSSDDDTEHA
jgi:hypothetical protein